MAAPARDAGPTRVQQLGWTAAGVALASIGLITLALSGVWPGARQADTRPLRALYTRALFVAGQIAWDKDQKIVSDDFIEQFDKALANVITVVRAAGGEPENIVRLVIYVTDKLEYRERTKAVGERYRKHMGKHFPAMTLVQVAGLLDDRAKVEIEGMAVIPA